MIDILFNFYILLLSILYDLRTCLGENKKLKPCVPSLMDSGTQGFNNYDI